MYKYIFRHIDGGVITVADFHLFTCWVLKGPTGQSSPGKATESRGVGVGVGGISIYCFRFNMNVSNSHCVNNRIWPFCTAWNSRFRVVFYWKYHCTTSEIWTKPNKYNEWRVEFEIQISRGRRPSEIWISNFTLHEWYLWGWVQISRVVWWYFLWTPRLSFLILRL